MLRNIMDNNGKVAVTTYTADVPMIRGMAVVKSGKVAAFPSAKTGVDLFFVTKEQIPTGIDSLRGEISDYDDTFEKITAGEYVKLVKYGAGEVFADDQYSGNVSDGTYLVAGTDGKMVAAATGEVTSYICRGTYDDNGHHLIMIEGCEPHTVA